MYNTNPKTFLIKKYEELLEFEKKTIFAEFNYINEIYSFILSFADKGDQECEMLYNIHSSLIKRCIDESINILKKANKDDLINLFYMHINRIHYIIYYLNKSFVYLDRYYTKRKFIPSLNKHSFDLFKNNFLIPFKGDLFDALIYFFKNNNNLDNEEKIKKIKRLFKVILIPEDMNNPKIYKKNNEIIWQNEDNNNNSLKKIDIWFNNYFLQNYITLIETKVKEFQNLSISEYISSILNFKYHPYILKIILIQFIMIKF